MSEPTDPARLAKARSAAWSAGQTLWLETLAGGAEMPPEAPEVFDRDRYTLVGRWWLVGRSSTGPAAAMVSVTKLRPRWPTLKFHVINRTFDPSVEWNAEVIASNDPNAQCYNTKRGPRSA